MQNKKAEIGIGTLIIFIAMILVAAIAAGVLIQTAGSLQNKALITGERTKSQVSTAISPTMIYAEDGSNGDVEEFFLTLKLAPGSDQVDMTQMLVTFQLSDDSADLSYVAGACVVETGFDTDPTTKTGNYTVEYLIEGTESSVGKLVTGDVVKVCMKAPRAISGDEEVKIGLIPKTGTSNIIEVLTPEVVGVQRVLLYP